MSYTADDDGYHPNVEYKAEPLVTVHEPVGPPKIPPILPKEEAVTAPIQHHPKPLIYKPYKSPKVFRPKPTYLPTPVPSYKGFAPHPPVIPDYKPQYYRGKLVFLASYARSHRSSPHQG